MQPMQIARLLVLSLLAACAAVAVVEGVARLAGVGAPGAYFEAAFTEGRPFVRRDGEVGFTLVPGYADDRYRINAAGFRGEDLPADLRARFTILCAGDSTTFGWRVSEGGDFPAHLGHLLRERHGDGSWVLNAGVPSFSSTQILRKLERDLPVVRPEVVVVTMSWNDLWVSALSPWDPEALVPRLPTPWQMWLLRRSAVFRAVAQPHFAAPEVNRSSAGAIDLFAANTGLMIDAVRRAGATPLLQTPPVDFDHVSTEGIRFAPTGLHWKPDFFLATARRFVERFRTVAAERSVAVAANPLSLENPSQWDLFLDEIHPTAAGYARMAAALLETLESEGLLPTVRR